MCGDVFQTSISHTTYLSTHRRHTFTFTSLANTLDTARHKLPPGRLHQLAGAFRVVFSVHRGILWWHHFCARACVEISFILQCCDCVTTCERSDLGCEPLTIRREFRRCVLMEYHSADRAAHARFYHRGDCTTRTGFGFSFVLHRPFRPPSSV
jgi:hypothetical protein